MGNEIREQAAKAAREWADAHVSPAKCVRHRIDGYREGYLAGYEAANNKDKVAAQILIGGSLDALPITAAQTDTKRLGWLLSFASVEDVGDEHCVPGVVFRIEDMENELCGDSLAWTPRQFIDAAIARIAAADGGEGR